MSTTKAETKPFWVDDAEWNRKYPKMNQANIADNVVSGIPDMERVEKGDIVGEYTFKDGLLVYHFYKKDRKKIYDDAFAEMDRIRDEGATLSKEESMKSQNAAAHKANIALAEKPWWPNFEKMLAEAFSEVFKYQEHKATFYSEVDSWSVILPVPSGLVRPNKQQLERPFSMLALRVQG